MREIKTHGFILKKIPYQNEKTQLFSVMTSDFGKITLSAMQSKKIQSSLRVLSPLNICEFEIYKSGNGYFKTRNVNLIHSLLDHKNGNEKNTLDIIQKLYVLAELIHITTEEEETNNRLYTLLTKTAIIIQETNNELIFESFKTKLLDLSGNLPNLKYCLECKKKCDNDAIWITEENLHLYCEKCIPKETIEPCKQLSLDSLKLLHYIKDSNFIEILKVKSHDNAMQKLRYLNDLLLTQILQCALKTTQKSLIGIN